MKDLPRHIGSSHASISTSTPNVQRELSDIIAIVFARKQEGNLFDGDICSYEFEESEGARSFTVKMEGLSFTVKKTIDGNLIYVRDLSQSIPAKIYNSTSIVKVLYQFWQTPDACKHFKGYLWQIMIQLYGGDTILEYKPSPKRAEELDLEKPAEAIISGVRSVVSLTLILLASWTLIILLLSGGTSPESIAKDLDNPKTPEASGLVDLD